MLKPREQVRRLVMWVAGVVLVLSVVAWGVSIREREWHPFRACGLWLARGELAVYYGSPEMFAWEFDYDGIEWARWRWPTLRHRIDRYYDWRGSPCWMLTVPLWLPAASSAIPLSLVGWRILRLGRSEVACPSCGYDLSGITGPCPECGREVTDPSPSP